MPLLTNKSLDLPACWAAAALAWSSGGIKPSLGFPNDSAEVSKTCLDEISHEDRQQKAVKSDNAQVPEYLWELHLIEGCEGINWDDNVISMVCTVIDWLRWWKRRVTSSYSAWVRAKYGIIAPQYKIAVSFTRKWTRFKTG
jgi:hypothetical protein